MELRNDNFEADVLAKKCNSSYNKITKRIIAILISAIMLMLFAPVMIIISMAIYLETGLPVFYRAARGGYDGRAFKIYKFRTMVKNAEEIGGGTTALNDCRITRVGKILRETKLDEIPQLINIIRGEMCFVGPRPELLKYIRKYDEKEKFILKVRPGITDYSSLEFISLNKIVGANNADKMYEKIVLKKKNKLRLNYVANLSIVTDIEISLLTIYAVTRKSIKIIINCLR